MDFSLRSNFTIFIVSQSSLSYATLYAFWLVIFPFLQVQVHFVITFVCLLLIALPTIALPLFLSVQLTFSLLIIIVSLPQSHLFIFDLNLWSGKAYIWLLLNMTLLYQNSQSWYQSHQRMQFLISFSFLILFSIVILFLFSL